MIRILCWGFLWKQSGLAPSNQTWNWGPLVIWFLVRPGWAKKKRGPEKPQEKNIGRGKNWLWNRWARWRMEVALERSRHNMRSDKENMFQSNSLPNPAFLQSMICIIITWEALKTYRSRGTAQMDLIRILGIKVLCYCYYFLFPQAIWMCSIQVGFGTTIF